MAVFNFFRFPPNINNDNLNVVLQGSMTVERNHLNEALANHDLQNGYSTVTRRGQLSVPVPTNGN